jgi:hypothetical protein
MTFPAQANAACGQAVAVPLLASDGLWCQGADLSEVLMDGIDRWQPGPWTPVSEPCPAAIDYVEIVRRDTSGAMPEIEVEIGCWRGAVGARNFVAVASVILPASQARARAFLGALLPVMDNISVGYSQADKVSCRFGNWKAIGEPSGSPWTVGAFAVDGTPASLFNDIEGLIAAAGF